MISVITGVPKSGKSDVATLLADTLRAPVLDSQRLQSMLPDPQTHIAGIETFEFIRHRMRRAVSTGRPLVVASSGMSWRFRRALRDLRSSIFHVHLTIDLDAALAKIDTSESTAFSHLTEAHTRANQTRFATPPDLTIDTSSQPAINTVARILIAQHTPARAA